MISLNITCYTQMLGFSMWTIWYARCIKQTADGMTGGIKSGVMALSAMKSEWSTDTDRQHDLYFPKFDRGNIVVFVFKQMVISCSLYACELYSGLRATWVPLCTNLNMRTPIQVVNVQVSPRKTTSLEDHELVHLAQNWAPYNVCLPYPVTIIDFFT